ncbi:serine acetyltransferase [Kineococcus glutinatus]|uniref:Serine acetyltransferase n=1 Tax=Kineococcus glutinatus TaxID=1070872 RepID=A0ABP9HMZ6_9ACTN
MSDTTAQQTPAAGAAPTRRRREAARHGSGGAATTAPLLRLLREDYETHYRDLTRPGLHALWVHRVGHWGLTRTGAARTGVKVVHRLLNNLLIRGVYGTEIADEAVIGRRVSIGHHQGVQIPAFCVVGDDTVIRHNVTIGFTGTHSSREDVPRIGRGVEIGAGASLLGPIEVGDGAKVGPHALVTVDVPAGATAFSPPARILKPQPDAVPASRGEVS